MTADTINTTSEAPAIKVLVVGRHLTQVPEGYDVVETRSVQFPATAAATREVVEQLLADAKAAGARLLFQAFPGQLTVALAAIATQRAEQAMLTGRLSAEYFGAVINKPGPRPAGVVTRYPYSADVEAAVKAVNPMAKVAREGDELIVTVDPPAPFVLERIEWHQF